MDLESAGDEFLFQEPEDFLGGAWGRERGAQVGIRIQDDPFRVDLASHVLDAFRGSLRGPAGIRLVPFLRADEGGKRFVHSRPPLRRGEIRRGFERLLLHLVLEGIDMEEEDPHGPARLSSRSIKFLSDAAYGEIGIRRSRSRWPKPHAFGAIGPEKSSSTGPA